MPPKKTPPLTDVQVQVAKDEVTAYYESELTRQEQAIEKARQELERAQERWVSAATAHAAWLDEGRITDAVRGPVDPASREYRALIGTIALSGAERIQTLARPVLDAMYDTSNPPATAHQRGAVLTAMERAELLKTWLVANGYPLPEYMREGK